MKRQDYIIFFLLVALLFAWPGIYQKFIADKKPAAKKPASLPAGTNTVAATPEETQPIPEPALEGKAESQSAASEPAESAEEIRTTLSNSNIEITVSSYGGAIVESTLRGYRETMAAGSPNVRFDFSDRPALSYTGLVGLAANNAFAIEENEAPSRLVLSKKSANGINLRREITIDQDYLVTVRDTFANEAPDIQILRQHAIRIGPMPEESAHSDMVGMINMGVDSLPPAGSVQNWGARIPEAFKDARDEQELDGLPEDVTFRPGKSAVEWVSAKNKYFVQILMPDGTGADWFDVYARRLITPAELAGARIKEPHISAVAADLGFESQELGPGESFTRTYEYYVGPKDYKTLSALSHARDAAMGFEENAYMDFVVVPAAKLLLNLLNFIHDNVWANYGVAIILLTIIVKIVFWPITHKGTESMRRMAAVQPLMAEIREKYKDNPQKMQQAMMALYKEHKINPMGGCLPMLVQIPVFFALFVVLRIGIELRFADFLWITDLSAPERIFEFGFTIPLLGWDALNILPLLMTITMVIQQKMSPAAGDPTQQKIMLVMMPAMMLFFLYNFASGLALYWTTQNILMIIQQLIYKQRQKKQTAAA